MTVLLDTNVALDVLLERQPFCAEARRIIVLSEKRIIESYVSASAITDIYYLTHKHYQDRTAALALLKNLLQTINPATVSNESVYEALNLEWSDFEDAVQYVVGASISADYLITRTPQDFSQSVIAVATPTQFLNIIAEVL
jgi:predicted nucleic acid-binding protein